jgi:DNA-binding transcriptional LysR family regulator
MEVIPTIQAMDINKVDLNLLRVFSAMLQHQNVTRAGQAIGLSQPAMSTALSRLRELFDEPLFVRSAGGMKPTPRALDLAEPVQRVLDVIRSDIMQPARFDPAASDRTFSISTADIGEIVILPRLLKRLLVEAPRARLRSLAMTDDVEQGLESGALDLAVGWFPELTHASIFQQRLYKYSFVCIVRAGHPAIGERLTLKQFLAAQHAVVRPDGRSRGIVEQQLADRGLERRVQLYVSHFTSLPAIIEGSDLVATVPRSVGETFSKLSAIRIVELPFRTPVNHVKQYWHRRFHRDAANVWLRELVAKLLHD